MTIGTSDGKSYKNEMSYLLDQHNNLSQEAQVADLDKRVPPPLPMVPSHSIAPHNPNPPGGGPYQIRPGEKLTSLVDKSAPAQWIGDKYYGRLFDVVDENPTSNIKLEHGKPGSHFGTVSPKEEIEMARDREDNPKIFKPDKQEVIPGTPITDPMLGYGSSRDVRISDVSPDPVTAGQQYAGNRIPQTLPGGEGLSIDSENLLHDPNRNKSYDVHNFNTGMSPDLREDFKKWKDKYAPNDHGHDYDLEGAFLQGVKPEKDGHFPDRFKKPNHPTFSEESIYHGADDMYGTGRAAVGGRWEKDGDHWIFHAAESNLKYHSAKELVDYFKKYEPGNKLVLPGQ